MVGKQGPGMGGGTEQVGGGERERESDSGLEEERAGGREGRRGCYGNSHMHLVHWAPTMLRPALPCLTNFTIYFKLCSG